MVSLLRKFFLCGAAAGQPHRNGGALAGYGPDGQAVFLAKAVLQTLVDVPHSHMAVLGGGLLRPRLGERFGGLLGGHADTVIGQRNQHIAVFAVQRDGQRNAPGTAFRLDAVEDGVFHKRLECEAGN